MESATVVKLGHKEWRRIAKKERRRRFRQRSARARDADAERLDASLRKSADYLNWLETQRVEEELKAAEEAKQHELREQKWLEEEVRAQKEWRIQQDRKAKAREEQLLQESRIRKEFEAKQEALREKKEEARRREEAECARLAEVEHEIDSYIEEGSRTPESLRSLTNTQPGKELCPFFSKTGACRYGDTCSRNHQRLGLTKVLLVPGFYSHFSLEKNSAEYDTDIALEFDGTETRHHFREFYNDVVPELETFGRIKTLKFCRNTEIHLRGNMYVEYYTEREAARALRSLKARWYAGRQLNCEFANLKSWRDAVCGMLKCPKGRACNFLHTFRNPRDDYDIKSPSRSKSRRSVRADDSTRTPSWSHHQSARNWRWSESPEPVTSLPDSSKQEEHRHCGTRRRRHESRRSGRGSNDDENPDDENNGDLRRRGSRSRGEGSTTKRRKVRRVEAEQEKEGGHNREKRSTRREHKEHRNGSKRRRSKREEGRKQRTKWDDPNGTTDSEDDERRRKASRRSRSRSQGHGDASEGLVASGTESDGRGNRTPHR